MTLHFLSRLRKSQNRLDPDLLGWCTLVQCGYEYSGQIRMQRDQLGKNLPPEETIIFE